MRDTIFRYSRGRQHTRTTERKKERWNEHDDDDATIDYDGTASVYSGYD